MRYDAVIIGGGPGGYECALEVSKLGGKVAVIEKGLLGGVCTNRGCIPTKALAATCEVAEYVKRSSEFGVDPGEFIIDVEKAFKRRDRVAMTLRKAVEKLLKDAGVDVIEGEAMLNSPNEVGVGSEALEAKNIVIATGSMPHGLPGIELDHGYVISGDDAAASEKLPEKVAVIGGGFIGCEYAAIYSKMGAEVTLIEALPRILSAEDEEVSAQVHKILSHDVDILVGEPVTAVDKDAKTVTVKDKVVEADTVLLAVGRKPVYPEGLGDLGVKFDKQGIEVDEHMKTNVDGVYAVGDCTHALKLAHVAYAGARVAAKNIMGQEEKVDYDSVPWCVFTLPEVGRVGLTEKQAGEGAKIGRSTYIGNGKARCMGERTGFCKAVADASGKIVGVHVIGAHASDIVGEATLAVKKGLTAKEVAETIHAHPTLCEVFRDACANML